MSTVSTHLLGRLVGEHAHGHLAVVVVKHDAQLTIGIGNGMGDGNITVMFARNVSLV